MCTPYVQLPGNPGAQLGTESGDAAIAAQMARATEVPLEQIAAENAAALAEQKATQEGTKRRRRVRASSLLATGATGGRGDTSLVTGQPYSKPTLGA